MRCDSKYLCRYLSPTNITLKDKVLYSGDPREKFSTKVARITGVEMF